jgi:hypothetical protein
MSATTTMAGRQFLFHVTSFDPTQLKAPDLHKAQQQQLPKSHYSDCTATIPVVSEGQLGFSRLA